MRAATEAIGHTPAVFGFVRNVRVTIAANGSLSLLGFVTGILVARLLGPQGRGELAAIQTWSALIATLGMLGMPEAVVYFAAREPARAGTYTASAVTLALLGSAPLLLAAYVAMPLLLASQSAYTVGAARWYMLIVLAHIAGGIPHTTLRAIGEFRAWNAVRFVPVAVWMATLALASWLKLFAAPAVAMLNLALHSVVAVPVVLLFVWPRIAPPRVPELHVWRAMLGYGLPSSLSGVPQLLNLKLDQMLMAALLPPALLGLYAVAVVWSFALTPFLSAVSVVLFPHLASIADRDAQIRTLLRVTKLGASGAFVMAAALIAVTPLGLPLVFGSDFAPAVPAAVMLVFAAAVLSFNQVLEEGLRGLGDPTSVMWSELGGLAATVVALLLLLRPLGIMGAALASVCGYTVVAALLVRRAREVTGLPLAEIIVPRRREISAGWRWIRASGK
jgi:O-antigen/teichoic acid export membrane protein